MNPVAVKDSLLTLQQNIVATLENLDGSTFRTDCWQRGEGGGGGGITRVIEDGPLFERGGVNFSHVTGPALPPSASVSRPELAGCGFEAMGVSLVLHPRNPYVPTVHMNVRFFRASSQIPRRETPGQASLSPSGREQGERVNTLENSDVYWFGGGMDLTPYYGFEDDAVHFHRTCRDALIPFGADLYPRFKGGCDRYFFLKHRNEARGVGGIFFDDFSEGGFDAAFAMTRAVGDAFLPAYRPIVERRREQEYGAREREWQAYRRGRYVEFNLVWDRGTLFGLQSGGRTESILMSMPPVAHWRYDWQPPAGSPEARLLTDFLPVRDWA